MPHLRTVALILLTIAVGSAGGAAFYLLGFPAPWLTGSVMAASIAVLSGAKLIMPPIVRHLAFLVLGVSIGSGVDAETLSGVVKWPASIAVLCVCVVLTIYAATAYLTAVAGWSRKTAFFSSIPGSLSYVVIMAMERKADTPLVVLAQMLRVVTLLVVLPLIIATYTPAPAIVAEVQNTGLWQALAVFAAGAACGLLLERFSFPAAMLFGGMFASAMLHVTSVVEGQVHAGILIPGQILLGCLMGLRFSGTNPRLLLKALGPSTDAFVIAVVISGVGAVLVWWLFDLPLNQLLIAFAPGALEVMIILAFVLGLDPTFVAAHHLVRFIGIALTLPLLTRLFLRQPPGQDEND
jgi:hypothetical protein